MKEEGYNELLIELECPVCSLYMAPPIRQCATGHSICLQCCNQLLECPLCKQSFTKAKNISLEALACKMLYPCVNRDAGCKIKLALNERTKHENTCIYNSFKCGIDRCFWSGRYDEIEMHWLQKKEASKPYGEDNTCRFKLKDDFNYVNLLKAHNQLFWFKCKAMARKVFWAVQYIGNEDAASNYFYHIELSKPDFPRCKTIMRAYCHKIRSANSEIFKEESCISMSREAIKQYVGEDGRLSYNMQVLEDKTNEAAGNAVGVVNHKKPKQNI